MEIQGISFATSDNNSSPSTFVEYSTVITVTITAFLAHMSVLAGQGSPVARGLA